MSRDQSRPIAPARFGGSPRSSTGSWPNVCDCPPRPPSPPREMARALTHVVSTRLRVVSVMTRAGRGRSRVGEQGMGRWRGRPGRTRTEGTAWSSGISWASGAAACVAKAGNAEFRIFLPWHALTDSKHFDDHRPKATAGGSSSASLRGRSLLALPGFSAATRHRRTETGAVSGTTNERGRGRAFRGTLR